MERKNIIIRPLQTPDYEATTRILFDSFHSKFTALTSLNDEDLFEFLLLMNIETSVAREGLYVAEVEGKVMGVLFLRWEGQNVPNDVPSPSLLHAARRFGLLNVIRFLFGMWILDEEYTSTDCYIEHIAVSEEVRGKGIGKQMLVFAEKFAKEQGFQCLTLNVTSRNTKAIQLYETLGFNIKSKISSWLSELMVKERRFYFMGKRV